jgi:hypothetical protein
MVMEIWLSFINGIFGYILAYWRRGKWEWQRTKFITWLADLRDTKKGQKMKA